MPLGNLTVVERIDALGPMRALRCTVVGDNAYPTGGSPGLLAKIRAALKGQENIVAVFGQGDNGDRLLEYDHANDKLRVRVISTGAEVAPANDQSSATYGLVIFTY